MQYRNIDKQALKENGYTVLSKITIVGTDTVFTEDDHIVDWTYEDYRYVPNNGFIGQFVERILDGNLQDISEDVVLEDTEINLQLGIVNALDNNTTTWYDYGNFLITKVEKTDTTGNYKFESADYTKKFNKVFDGDYTDTTYTKSFNERLNDEETVTALWLAQYVCAQAGVLLNDTNFTNYDFVISSNQYDSGDTLRKVMQDIGKLAYSWVRVGEDNKVHIDFTPKSTSSVDQYDQLTTDEYYVSKKSDLSFGPVNKVLIGMSDVEGENLYETSEDYTEETECAIKIYDNNLTNTEELRALALNGCDRLFGLTYTPIEINSVGHPWLDGDELIKLTNVDGEIIYTYPFNRKITYAGYIEGTIGAEAQTAQESKYEYKSDIISDVKKTSFIVDKQEQTITGLVENMNDIILETTIKKTEEGNPIEIYDAGSYPVEDFKIYGNAVQDGTPSVQNPVEIETLTSKEENETYSGTNIEFYNDTDNYSIENNYVLEGQTTQDGTPTPSNPVPINVVTGLQKIDVCGKNLFDLNKATNVLISDTGTESTNTSIKTSPYIRVNTNNSYSYSCTLLEGKTVAWVKVSYYGENKNYLGYQFLTDVSTTLTLPTGTNYLRFGYHITYCENIMLNTGQPTTYEPYIGNTYEINLGCNLFDTYNNYSTHSFTLAGISYTISTDGVFTLNGTSTGYNGPYTIGGYSSTNILLSMKANHTYRFLAKVEHNINEVPMRMYVGTTSHNDINIQAMSNGIFYVDYTPTTDKVFNQLSLIGSTESGQVHNNTKVQIGIYDITNIIVNDYIPYFTPIFLGGIGTYKNKIFKGNGINLANIDDIQVGKYWNGQTNTQRASILNIPILPSTQYTILGSWTNSHITQVRVISFANIGDVTHSGAYSGTFTSPATANYVSIEVLADTTFTSTMLEGLEILFCKDSATMQDYEPYNAKDKWLLRKEIGKTILTGSSSEMWNINNSYTYNVFYIIIGTLKKNIYTKSTICNYYNAVNNMGLADFGNGNDNSICVRPYDDAYYHLYISNDAINSVADFKTWLSTHNTEVYYVLANPTTEEITNEELISQLDSIELLGGLNNIFITSSNLPGILNINQTKYPYQIIRIKDNIGIYNDYKLILKDVEYARVTDNRDYIYPENDKWYSYKIINKINSYNGETIDTDYISTTGELSTGATVYYVADEPNIQEIVDENILTPLNDLKNTLLYNGYNKIELLNELVDKLSITYLTDSELNASYATKSELQITANNITSTVSETTTKVNELDEKIEEVNASISEQTSTSITDWFNTSLKSLIEDLETSTNNNSNEIINIQSYIRRGRITDVTSPYYNQAYIELGDSTNQTTLRILQNRIQFLTNGEETAYISNNQLYINESTILTKEKIGHWVTTEDEDGLLNTYWEE